MNSYKAWELLPEVYQRLIPRGEPNDPSHRRIISPESMGQLKTLLMFEADNLEEYRGPPKNASNYNPYPTMDEYRLTSTCGWGGTVYCEVGGIGWTYIGVLVTLLRER